MAIADLSLRVLGGEGTAAGERVGEAAGAGRGRAPGPVWLFTT
jgi:hypothetical protein